MTMQSYGNLDEQIEKLVIILANETDFQFSFFTAVYAVNVSTFLHDLWKSLTLTSITDPNDSQSLMLMTGAFVLVTFFVS